MSEQCNICGGAHDKMACPKFDQLFAEAIATVNQHAYDRKELTAVRVARRRLYAAEAIVSRLPVYADTGEPFVPGRDEAWIWLDGKAQPLSGDLKTAITFGKSVRIHGQWRHYCGIHPGKECAYSTRAAAEAASGEKEQD